jgi:hypothetical protein
LSDGGGPCSPVDGGDTVCSTLPDGGGDDPLRLRGDVCADELVVLLRDAEHWTGDDALVLPLCSFFSFLPGCPARY